MGGKHNKCCCSVGTVFIYAASSGAPRVIRKFDADTGDIVADIYTPASVVNGMACDFNGNLYITDNTSIIALTPTGTVRWTASHGAFLRGIAVTIDGWVYTVGHGDPCLIRKWNADTGVENTTGWPITFGTGFGVVVGVCVDQSSNVYVSSQTSDASGHRVKSYTSSGAVRWGTAFSAPTPTNISGRGIAIDANNTQVGVAAQPAVPATERSGHWFNAATGAHAGQLVHGNTLTAAAYGPTGTRYLAGSGNNPFGSAATNYAMRKDATAYYNAVESVDGGPITGTIIGHDGGEFICLSATSTQPVRRIGVWRQSIGSANGATAIEHSLGKVGAFGVR